MSNKKKVIILFCGIFCGILLIGLTVIGIITYVNESKKIKLGMSYDEVIKILEDGDFHYEINETGTGKMLIWADVPFLGMQGFLSIIIDPELDPENVCQIQYSIDVNTKEELNEKLAVVKDYLSDQYGEFKYDPKSSNEDPKYKYYDYGADDFAVMFRYPREIDTDINTDIIIWWMVYSE